MRRAVLASLLAVATIAASAPAADGAVADTRVAKVTVRLSEWKVVPSAKRVPAGKVTFVARNVGNVPHNLVVLRTNRAPGKLPLAGNRAKEVGRVGKTPVFRPGQTRRLAPTLKTGKYVLICNVPGHYKAGMFVGFRVG